MTLQELVQKYRNKKKHKKSNTARNFVLSQRREVEQLLSQGYSLDAIVSALNELAAHKGLRRLVQKGGKKRWEGVNITVKMVKDTLNIK